MKYFISLLFVVVMGICQATDYYDIKGQILDENGSPIAKVNISVLQHSVQTTEQGTFSLRANRANIYQFKVKHPDYFTSIQTFSHYELDAQNQEISQITLVKKSKNRVMLAFGGDVMMGRRYYTPYFGDQVLITKQNKLEDSKAIVKHIKPYMSLADYALVNLETQIAEEKPKQRAPKSVTFYSEPETLAALEWAGIDYVSLGNNHTYDYMDEGLASTLNHLQRSNLAYSGAGINETEALKAHNQVIKNQKFALLGYVGWQGSATPKQTASEAQGGAAYGSVTNMVNSVSEQVSQDNITVVQYHGSQEYADSPTNVTEQRLKSSLDAGASLAIAHHPHVTQGLELYNNKLIAYSMGNFIFDQNFSATQHSFILYVWLDEGKFHRAEIVPLYIKGYKPTPATGMHRYTVLKRLAVLSSQRNTVIEKSGGHGVINRETHVAAIQHDESQIRSMRFQEGERVKSLYSLPWDTSITQVLMPTNEQMYRLGTNLINGSDFESFSSFDSVERGWLFDRTATKVNDFGNSGERSIAISLENNEASLFGMQSFRRVYKASSQMTIKAAFQSQSTVKVNFYWQGRKNKQKLFDALDNGEKHYIGTAMLTGQKDWQNIEVDFNSPRVGYRSYRVLAEFVLLDDQQAKIHIDDFALIEWQSAFNKDAVPNLFNIETMQASYIGLLEPTEKPIMIKHGY